MCNQPGSLHYVTAKTLKAYVKEKIKILERDFCIRLTPEDIRHFNELKTEIAVDNFALSLIMR